MAVAVAVAQANAVRVMQHGAVASALALRFDENQGRCSGGGMAHGDGAAAPERVDGEDALIRLQEGELHGHLAFHGDVGAWRRGAEGGGGVVVAGVHEEEGGGRRADEEAFAGAERVVEAERDGFA